MCLLNVNIHLKKTAGFQIRVYLSFTNKTLIVSLVDVHIRCYKRLGLLVNIVFPHLHVFGLSVENKINLRGIIF